MLVGKLKVNFCAIFLWSILIFFLIFYSACQKHKLKITKIKNNVTQQNLLSTNIF